LATRQDHRDSLKGVASAPGTKRDDCSLVTHIGLRLANYAGNIWVKVIDFCDVEKHAYTEYKN